MRAIASPEISLRQGLRHESPLAQWVNPLSYSLSFPDADMAQALHGGRFQTGRMPG
jgi:hypothetical protein